MTDSKLAQYQAKLAQQGIPSLHAQNIAAAIVDFEQNELQSTPTTRWLLERYKSQICQANLWRYRLLSDSDHQRIRPEHFYQ